MASINTTIRELYGYNIPIDIQGEYLFSNNQTKPPLPSHRYFLFGFVLFKSSQKHSAVGDESLRFVLASRSPCKRPCFRRIRGSRIFLSSLQTHIHMQTSLASFRIVNTSRIILREHTLLLHGLLLVPHLHSLGHSTPRPFGYY